MFEVIRIDIFRLDLRVALARTVSLQLRLTIFHAIGRNAVHGKAVVVFELAAIGQNAPQFLISRLVFKAPALIDHEALVLAVMAAMVRIAGRPERRELADQSLGVRNIKSGIAKNGNILSGKVRFSLIAVCRRSLAAFPVHTGQAGS